MESDQSIDSPVQVKNDSNLLDWESRLYLEVMEDDGLLILAKGLGLDRIFLKIVQTFCKPENLVFVLNTIPEEQFYYLNELSALGVNHLPKVLTADNSTDCLLYTSPSPRDS